MNDWFRSWHGAPTDPKWLLIAKRADTIPAVVSAIVWALFDHASQQTGEHRGDVNAFDRETYSLFSGVPEEAVDAVITALEDKGLIRNGRLTAWEKRQPKREDGSAERSKQWRERNRTQPNANDHREEEIREDKKDAAPDGAHPSDLERELFARGKQVLGKGAGGMIANLLKAKGGKPELARAVIETAATKQNPREYVARVITGPPGQTNEGWRSGIAGVL